MWDGFNKRKFPRVNRECEIVVESESGKSPIKTKTENIGAGGVCVILNQSLERYSPCHVSLELEEKSPRIECDSKVVWAIPSKNPRTRKKSYDTGIEFVDLDTHSQAVLKRFISAQSAKQTSR